MFQISLPTKRRRLLALALGLAALAVAGAATFRSYLASQALTAWDAETLARAVRLEPDDAAYQHRLGRWEELSFAEGNLERARAHYREATRLNPYESEYWLDLAGALEFTGARAEADAAIARALRADPRTPRTLWRAGNFWLRTTEPQRAFPYFKQALAADPDLAATLLQSCHQAVRDPEVVLREVLPPKPLFYLVYLWVVVREGEFDAAAPVWRGLVALGQPFDPRQALFYLDHLIGAGQVDEARQAWEDLKRLKLIPAINREDEELLYNADLRQPILGGGFDWRVAEHPHVSIATGDARPGAVASAVIIQFSGEDNLHYQHFFQYVPVAPGARYRFEAWMATENVSTESGPRLEVADAGDPQRPPARSVALVGTNGWQRVSVEFTGGPQTRLVRVGIVRLPSQRMSGEIRGTVRAAEFSLRRLSSGTTQ